MTLPLPRAGNRHGGESPFCLPKKGDQRRAPRPRRSAARTALRCSDFGARAKLRYAACGRCAQTSRGVRGRRRCAPRQSPVRPRLACKPSRLRREKARRRTIFPPSHLDASQGPTRITNTEPRCASAWWAERRAAKPAWGGCAASRIAPVWRWREEQGFAAGRAAPLVL